MTKEEAELIIKEQDKSTKEILKMIEQQKCELLGIIQDKDKAIKDLEWQLQEVAKDNDYYQAENKKLEEENAELDMKRKAERKIFQGIVEKKNDQLAKAKEILQTVLDKWKEERWILQSEKEVKQIENLMKQTEQFLEK